MKLIFAQGNPGQQYVHTRHNTGFIILNSLSHNTSWKKSDKFNAEIAETTLNGEKVLLAKPLTFYNETGQSAQALVNFYKLDPSKDMLVIHDDLALPLGTIRVREKGSDAGNNGIKSLNAHLGPHYFRMRVGIWNEKRNFMDDANFVLSSFSEEELKILNEKIIPQAFNLIKDFLQDKLQPTSHRLE